MKTLRVFVLILISASIYEAKAQNTMNLDSLVKLNFNYAIPDLPAFNALETEPSNLLRPSSSKDFSIVANEFFDGKNIVIPKAIAIEIAPIKLMKQNSLTLSDYQKSPALYNMRISIGSLRDTSNISKVAIGIRTTLIDKSDIKSKENIEKVYAFLNKKVMAKNKFIDDQLDIMDISEEEYAESPEIQSKIDSLYSALQSTTLKAYLKEHSKYNNWNEEKLDIALSLVGNSPDSIFQNIRFNSLVFWVTYANAIGKNGQILLGGNTRYYNENSTKYFDITIPVRYYYGSNFLKGYIEGQYSYKQNVKSSYITYRMGCEYHLHKGLWLNFGAGVANDITSNSSKFVSNVKFVYAISDN